MIYQVLPHYGFFIIDDLRIVYARCRREHSILKTPVFISSTPQANIFQIKLLSPIGCGLRQSTREAEVHDIVSWPKKLIDSCGGLNQDITLQRFCRRRRKFFAFQAPNTVENSGF